MRTFRFIELGEQASISAVFRCCCALMAASFFALPWSWPSHSQSQCPELCIRFMSVVAARAHELYFFRLCGCATTTCPPPPLFFFSNRFFLLGYFLSPTRRTPKNRLWIGDESCESDAYLHAPEGPACPPRPRLGAPPSSIEKHFVLPPILYAVHFFLHSHSQSFLRSFPLVPTPVFYIVPVPLQW